MKSQRGFSFTTLLAAFAGAVFLFSFSVVFVLNLRQVYYHDVRSLNVAEELKRYSGMELTEEQIEENYDVLIDYNLLWKGVKRLEFPDFPMSEHGRIHFEEVRRIFVMIQYAMFGSLALLIFGLWGKIRRSEYSCLKWISVLTVVIPVILGSLVAINWEWFFVTFHRLAFSNDYWLFDPMTDPIILVLPDAFFFHCAAGILICILVGSAVSYAAYRILTFRRRNMQDGRRLKRSRR